MKKIVIHIFSLLALCIFASTLVDKAMAGRGRCPQEYYDKWQKSSGAGAFYEGDKSCLAMDGTVRVSDAISLGRRFCEEDTTNCKLLETHTASHQMPTEELCRQALNSSQTDWWWTGQQDPDQEKKDATGSRGLTVGKCRLALGLPEDPMSVIKNKSDTEVCEEAILWTLRPFNTVQFKTKDNIWVKEATSRHLTEAICTESHVQKLAQNSNSTLCKFSVVTQNGDTRWSPSEDSQLWVMAAKKKGLDPASCKYAETSDSELCWKTFGTQSTDDLAFSAEMKARQLDRGMCLRKVQNSKDVCGLALNELRDNWSNKTDSTVVFANDVATLSGLTLGYCRAVFGLPENQLSESQLRQPLAVAKYLADYLTDAYTSGLSEAERVRVAETRQKCLDAINHDSKADFDVACPKMVEFLQFDAGYKSYQTHSLEIKKMQEASESDLAELKKKVAELVAKVDDFAKHAKGGSQSFDLIAQAISLKTLSDTANLPEKEKLATALQSFTDLVAHDQGYGQYLADKEKAKKDEEEQKVAEETGKLTIARDFVTDFVAHNMLNSHSSDLLTVMKEVNDSLASKDIDRIKRENEQIQKRFVTFQVTDNYNAFVAQKCSSTSVSGCSQIGGDTKVTTDNKPTVVNTDVGRRVALVIGNSAYQNANQLPNPKHDAMAISAKLKSLGFEVTEAEDLDKPGMDSAVRRFETSLDGSKVAFLFYAGHGMQYEGHNYLIPVDAKLADATALSFETVSVDQILGTMADPNRVSIAMLDSCRDNPLARSFSRKLSRSAAVGSGMAAATTDGGGMLIGFATAPDQTASDGDGDHSPFTKALLDNMDEKGIEVGLMFKHVRQEVMDLTKNTQQPWENSSLGEFYLNR